MQVKVLFFGILSEVTGTDLRHIRDVKSINDLKLKLLDEYPEIEHYNYRISHNNEIIISDRNLNDGDEIALMPPFEGG
jgi:molybdopterin synthase sulfur carrier subunit